MPSFAQNRLITLIIKLEAVVDGCVICFPISSNLENCNGKWGPRYKKDINALEAVQRMATRLLLETEDLMGYLNF